MESLSLWQLIEPLHKQEISPSIFEKITGDELNKPPTEVIKQTTRKI